MRWMGASVGLLTVAVAAMPLQEAHALRGMSPIADALDLSVSEQAQVIFDTLPNVAQAQRDSRDMAQLATGGAAVGTAAAVWLGAGALGLVAAPAVLPWVIGGGAFVAIVGGSISDLLDTFSHQMLEAKGVNDLGERLVLIQNADALLNGTDGPDLIEELLRARAHVENADLGRTLSVVDAASGTAPRRNCD